MVHGTSKCFYCERSFGFKINHLTGTHFYKTKDHIIPLSRGGTNNENNKIFFSCNECNCLKASYLPNEFVEFLEKIKRRRKIINKFGEEAIDCMIKNSKKLQLEIELYREELFSNSLVF